MVGRKEQHSMQEPSLKDDC